MILVSLRSRMHLTRDTPASLVAEANGRRTRLTGLDSSVQELLLRLAEAPVVLDSKGAGPSRGPSGPGLPASGPAFRQLAERRLIQLTCSAAGRELMVAVPAGGPSCAEFDLELGEQLFRLSRFMYARSLRGQLVVESPLRFWRVHLLDPDLASLLTGLAHGESVAGLCKQHPHSDEEVIHEAVRFLAGVGAIGLVSDEGKLQEDADPDLAPREFHDVAFHASTRSGLATGRVGAVFPFLGSIPPAPAIKPAMSANPVRLTVPYLDDMLRNDPSLARVMEERRSVRYYGQRDITLEEVSEFLYRTSRVRSFIPAEGPESKHPYDSTRRPYPSGGAAFDLELYLTFRHCEGIASGIYHYDPAGHALSLVCSRPALISAMLEKARRATGQPEAPPVLITFASRFNRLSWKYRAISYATTLKNVGVLYEAMYLAATAMGLAPCALGCGDSALFCRATGLHPLVESSVGEFMLGPHPAHSAQKGA
jgi:oxazoline/thiazoline dehydrogenase